MFELYSRAGLVLRNNFWLFAAFAAIEVFVDNLDIISANLGGKLVLYGFITLFSHRLILSGASTSLAESFRADPNGALAGPMLPFMLRFAGLILIGAVIWAISAFCLWYTIETHEEYLFLMLMIASLCPAALLFYGVLALAGTTLPAAARGQDASFGRAFEIGRKGFALTYLRLIGGNFLFTLVNIAIAIGLVVWLPVSQSIPLVYATDWLVKLCGIFALLLTATALCMAYEDGQSTAQIDPA
ncbi:hypothetical protein [Pseudophaeobacter sp.]|uniref:hypothetical protein n=1 Tax=Pseudophaeobacter sp. TaxID=1971739 RepID=UPI002603F537|nr:hypothetical protein [Pseudophaeobacter sp.]